jgi:hypothetical protein
MLFKALLGIDVIIAGVFVFFFITGVGDGSVSAFNMMLWLGILVGIASVLLAGSVLKATGATGPANLVLVVLAGPGVAAALFFLLLILSQPRWN